MAGRDKNMSETGKCALFKDTTYMNVTNEQVISGLLYIGLFSEQSSSRTQSQMIARGATYKFGMQLVATTCRNNFVGADCNQVINILPAGLNTFVNNSYCADTGTWTLYSLDVSDSAAAVEIIIDTESPRNVRLLAKHSAFPTESDEVMFNQSQTITIETPRRGIWYIRVLVHNSTGSRACFTLSWKIKTCSSGYGGLDCGSPLIMLERVLSKPKESPFDSNYVPVQKPVQEDSFSWKLLRTDNTTKWIYFPLEIPRGAAGSVYSFEMGFSSTLFNSIEVFTRLGGYPTNNTWDSHYTSILNQNAISFDVIYPAEGTWFIGIVYSLQAAAADLKLQITLHGCRKSCSHHGACVTSYDASHLTFFSFCRCDRTHGGIDCSEKLLSNSGIFNLSRLHLYTCRKCVVGKTVQIFALVGSNAAAILPSLWALRHGATSEWLVYTSSGISSAIYHSCDAGGWCAMSFDTLQFLDFWLSFLAVVFTCLYLAEVLGLTKPTLHIAAAIITAIIAKQDRTSTKSAVAVIAIGAVGLLLGLFVEMWRQKPMQRWQMHSLVRQWTVWYGFKNRTSEFIKKLRSKFIWAYVGIGICVVAFAGLCFKLEKANTYWIWHSLWHVSIYTGAFILLYSVAKAQAIPPSAPENSNSNEMDTFVISE